METYMIIGIAGILISTIAIIWLIIEKPWRSFFNDYDDYDWRDQ